MKRWVLIAAVGLVAVVMAFSLTGCQTTDAANTGSLASVTLPAASIDQIRQTIVEVFETNGYTKVASLTFERKGSTWDQINYGGMTSDPVWIKIKGDLTQKADGYYVLSCDAYIVNDHDDPLIKQERQLTFAKAGECKKILDEIQHRLSTSAP